MEGQQVEAVKTMRGEEEVNRPLEAEQPELPPEVKKEADQYTSILSKLMHSKDTKAQIYEMLQAGDPMETIPQTASAINMQGEALYKRNNPKLSLDALFIGAQFLVIDLVEIGNTGGFFEVNMEDEKVAEVLLKNTIQPYVEQGLKDGTIDPIELQEKVEPLMKNIGGAEDVRKEAEANGMPMEPGVDAAMEAYRKEGVMQERSKVDKMKQSERQGQVVEGAKENAQAQGVLR